MNRALALFFIDIYLYSLFLGLLYLAVAMFFIHFRRSLTPTPEPTYES